jgi:hypothetical protein
MLGSPVSAVISQPTRGIKLKNELTKDAFELTTTNGSCTEVGLCTKMRETAAK